MVGVATVSRSSRPIDTSPAARRSNLVLLDWMMPVLSGLEALKRLRRASRPRRHLYALGGSNDVVGALELGA